MSQPLDRALEKLKVSLLQLATMAEEQVTLALRSLTTESVETAQRVVQRDDEVDNKEVDIEEECLKILALYQPVAFDLRFVVAVLKINSDLERIGDLAVNIAQ
ncbi:MAG: hypothetical protein KDD44_11340, partial [Bdellovibrionales bacterium]|nr:hypothetical protein [Bdellovibrionales bacterium]